MNETLRVMCCVDRKMKIILQKQQKKFAGTRQTFGWESRRKISQIICAMTFCFPFASLSNWVKGTVAPD
jgi:hypothetical protein